MIAADQQDRISLEGINLLGMNPESLKVNKQPNISQISDLASDLGVLSPSERFRVVDVPSLSLGYDLPNCSCCSSSFRVIDVSFFSLLLGLSRVRSFSLMAFASASCLATLAFLLYDFPLLVPLFELALAVSLDASVDLP